MILYLSLNASTDLFLKYFTHHKHDYQNHINWMEERAQGLSLGLFERLAMKGIFRIYLLVTMTFFFFFFKHHQL